MYKILSVRLREAVTFDTDVFDNLISGRHCETLNLITGFVVVKSKSGVTIHIPIHNVIQLNVEPVEEVLVPAGAGLSNAGVALLDKASKNKRAELKKD